MMWPTIKWCFFVLGLAAASGFAEHIHDEDGYHPRMLTNTENVLKFNPDELKQNYWVSKSQDAIRQKLERPHNTNIAKNIIFFLGDGLSVPTLAATRTYLGQREGATGEERELSFEKFPAVGLSKTYCVDAQIADSACTATAYLTGIKNNIGTIGVTADVSYSDCPASQVRENQVESIAKWAMDSGKDAGIVTTTRITHASPSGAYAKISNRNWETDLLVNTLGGDSSICNDIAIQLVHEDPGNRFKVILGGGRRNFRNSTVIDEEGSSGIRSDGRDLIQEWQTDKQSRNVSYDYVWNRNQLLNVDYENTEYLMGLFEANHLEYNMLTNPETEPSLTDMTEAAIKMLSKNENGYFVFIEAGRIDHAHHDNKAQIALDETIELHKAVEKALEMSSPEDTLIVVTADHAHVMTINGYTERGTNIAGVSGDYLGNDAVPYMTLSYTNGPGFLSHAAVGVRQDPSLMDWTNPETRYPAEVPLDSETHGGDDVAVFAYGPYEHLFTGLYEQSDIPHIMAYAACIGNELQACASSASNVVASATIILAAVFSFLNLNVWA